MHKLKLGLTLALATILVAMALPAWACSCVLGDPRDELAEADAAFIGELVSKRPVTDNEQRSIYTFRVIEDVKRDLGRTVEVRSATQGSACGIEMETGQRTGLFLYRTRGGAWASSLCSQISPRSLREAAKPLPRPNGKGRARLVVGGSFGRARVMALNAAARTIEYGFGGNSDVTHLDLCPGGKRMVEVTQTYNDRRNRWRITIATRSIAGATKRSEVVARFLWKKRFQNMWPRAVSCQNADGSRAVLFVTSGFGAYAKAAIAYVRGSRIPKLRRMSARDAVFDRGVAYLTGGRYGRRVVALNLATGVKRKIAEFRRPIDALSMSPDGTKVAGIEREHCGRDGGCSPSRLVLIRVSDRRVRRLALEVSGESAHIAWWGNKRLVVANPDFKAYTYNLRLKRLGVVKDWYTGTPPVVLEGLLFGIDYGSVMRARLPDGTARRIRRLPSPVTNALIAVP